MNDVCSMEIAGISPKLKTGLYGEYRTRKYTTREFIYNWNPGDNSLPDNRQGWTLSRSGQRSATSSLPK